MPVNAYEDKEDTTGFFQIGTLLAWTHSNEQLMD